MQTGTPTIILVFQTLLAALLISMLAAVVSTWFARRIQLIDRPGSAPHKLHAKPVPLAGGIALIVTLLIGEYFFGNFANKMIRASFIAALPVFVFRSVGRLQKPIPFSKTDWASIGSVISDPFRCVHPDI